MTTLEIAAADVLSSFSMTQPRIIAAIDIGSNSLKLAIVEARASGDFTIIRQARERLRLGQETLQTRRLSDEATKLAAAAIERFRLAAEQHGAGAVIAVATASVREAENGDEFACEIERRTGVEVRVLSSLEEARLIGVAAAQSFKQQNSVLNIDIGGGSTELSLMVGGEPRRLFSMKIGAVGLTERFIFSNPPRANELENLRAEIAAELAQPAAALAGETPHIATGTSGTILNLHALLHFQTGEKTARIESKRLTALNEMLARISLADRARLPVISPQRAEVIVAGGQILEAAMRALNIENLAPCVYALREGVIIDYLKQNAKKLNFSPHPAGFLDAGGELE